MQRLRVVLDYLRGQPAIHPRRRHLVAGRLGKQPATIRRLRALVDRVGRV